MESTRFRRRERLNGKKWEMEMAMGRMKRRLTSCCSKRWTLVNVGTSVAQLVNKVTVAHIHHEERWGKPNL